MKEHNIIINTTPLGMYPDINSFPDIPYEFINKDSFLFDLVYNPGMTLFLKKGSEQGATVKNGLEMLHLQAEKAWEIWNNSKL
jgi:shikimate dehydrogenase